MKITVNTTFKLSKAFEMRKVDIQFMAKICRMNRELKYVKEYFDELEIRAKQKPGWKDGQLIEIRFDPKSLGFQSYIMGWIASLQSLCESYYYDSVSLKTNKKQRSKTVANSLKVSRRSSVLDSIPNKIRESIQIIRNTALHCSSFDHKGYGLVNHDLIVGCYEMADAFNNLALDILSNDTTLYNDLGLGSIHNPELNRYQMNDIATGLELFHLFRT